MGCKKMEDRKYYYATLSKNEGILEGDNVDFLYASILSPCPDPFASAGSLWEPQKSAFSIR